MKSCQVKMKRFLCDIAFVTSGAIIEPSEPSMIYPIRDVFVIDSAFRLVGLTCASDGELTRCGRLRVRLKAQTGRESGVEQMVRLMRTRDAIKINVCIRRRGAPSLYAPLGKRPGCPSTCYGSRNIL